MKHHEKLGAIGSDIKRRSVTSTRRVGGILLGMALLTGCGTTNGGPNPTTPTEGISATSQPMPDPWPSAETLSGKNCNWGQPIDHQRPRYVGKILMAQVDTRCEPPLSQDYAAVYDTPTFRDPAIGSVRNGQWVALECQQIGEYVGDNRGSEQTDTWVKFVYQDMFGDNTLREGVISVANLGQLDLAGANIPTCPS